LISINKKKGISAKKPTKNLVPLKVKGPILSIPVSWAMKVVPQINVQTNALAIDNVFVILFILISCMQSSGQDFL